MMSTLRRLSNQLTEAALKRQGQILPSDKRDYGYFDRINFRFVHAEEIWAVTFGVIMSEMPDVPSAAIRDYLDSKSGMNFGELVAELIKKTSPIAYSPGDGKVMPPNMAAVKRIVKSVFSNNAWIRKHIEAYSKDQDVAPNGTMLDIEKLVDAVGGAFNLARQAEQKKNWKDRDLIMHDLQKMADGLSTAARAWLAQRR